MGEHTKTPWVAGNNEGYSAWTVWSGCHPSGGGPTGKMIAEVVGDSAETDANAAFIVKAVNSHDMLVATLSEIINYQGGADHAMADEYVVNRARAALAELDPPEPPTANDDGGRGE